MNKLGNIDIEKFNWGHKRIWFEGLHYSTNGNGYSLGWCLELTNRQIGSYSDLALTLGVF